MTLQAEDTVVRGFLRRERRERRKRGEETGEQNRNKNRRENLQMKTLLVSEPGAKPDPDLPDPEPSQGWR